MVGGTTVSIQKLRIKMANVKMHSKYSAFYLRRRPVYVKLPPPLQLMLQAQFYVLKEFNTIATVTEVSHACSQRPKDMREEVIDQSHTILVRCQDLEHFLHRACLLSDR